MVKFGNNEALHENDYKHSRRLGSPSTSNRTTRATQQKRTASKAPTL